MKSNRWGAMSTWPTEIRVNADETAILKVSSSRERLSFISFLSTSLSRETDIHGCIIDRVNVVVTINCDKIDWSLFFSKAKFLMKVSTLRRLFTDNSSRQQVEQNGKSYSRCDDEKWRFDTRRAWYIKLDNASCACDSSKIQGKKQTKMKTAYSDDQIARELKKSEYVFHKTCCKIRSFKKFLFSSASSNLVPIFTVK